MDRRRFLLTSLAGALATPLAVEAQHRPQAPRVGFLEATPGFDHAFREGLRQFGYVEGKNIGIEWRWARARAERFPEFAAELVQLKVNVIVATNNPAVAAAQKATETIPIVMVIVTDPVSLGFVASFARPAGNITGLTIQAPELAGKRLQLFREAVPHLTRVAVLWDPTEPGRQQLVKETEAAAPRLGLQVQALEVRNPGDIGSAFAAMAREAAEAVLIYGSSILYARRAAITELAMNRRLPTMCSALEWMDAGFTMSYGTSLKDMYRRAAYFVDKILKGAKPADLPVEQPTKFELVINMKTAKALGLTIPPSLLARANHLIE
jgi:putative tryptophan/tyrosine transport system substrate-binding protein